MALAVNNLLANAGAIRDLGSIPGLGGSPEGGHGNHSSVLAWRILWTEEPDGLSSTELQRVGHYRSDLAHPSSKEGWFLYLLP